ncbi:MAG: mechanosensitive ion channel, partial [Bacteroidales bacterium]|nr:mechanosensitive ion channel [Bacteroidales bacterium]
FAAKNGNVMLRANEINFTLANNIIGILVWGTYAISAIILVKIPMGAISIVAAGLATGIGLAMKDILNNFIYGIQLMSGRLRVGDWIECDGVRGKVTSISYQCTQIETLEGATMSFLNATLFSKNFMNLTRNNSYEFVKIVVGVNYGADVEKVRSLLLDALEAMKEKDMYGRDIVDLTKDISVTFDNFADSSIELAIKQYVLVSQRTGYIARAKEIIYNTLTENNIEIPFPKRDVNLRVIDQKQ